VSLNFKFFLLSDEFHNICDWQRYQIPIKKNRPALILAIEDLDDPDKFLCIPISKDDDKNNKYANLMSSKPDLVHPVEEINTYDNYLLIQNMFYIRKEFIGEPFIVDGVQSEIKKDSLKRAIVKKVKKVDALINRGVLNYVPREEVFNKQLLYLENRTKKERREVLEEVVTDKKSS
jgi:hypothetical protein